MKTIDLIKQSNYTTREFGEKVGLSGGQISQISRGKAKVSPMLEKICRFLFWKEMGIERQEIIKELGLDDPNPAALFVNEEKDVFGEKTDREKRLIKMVDQLNRDNRTLMKVIENLNKQLEK